MMLGALKKIICFQSLFLSSLAICSPMEFKHMEGIGECEGCQLIEATGEIVGSTSEEFEKFIGSRSFGNKDTTVVFSSKGGSLNSGLKLGELIRTNGFNTYVGVVVEEVGGRHHVSDAQCASACAYAFLGGVKRSMGVQSQYGLHQISSSSGASIAIGVAVRETQNLIAQLIEYVERMDISTEVVTIATGTSNTSINWIDRNKLTSLGVLNSRGLIAEVPWERMGHTSGNFWKVISVSSEGYHDLFMLSCREIPYTGEVYLTVRPGRGMPKSTYYYDNYFKSSIRILFNGEVVHAVFGETIFPSNGGYSAHLKIPLSVLMDAIKTYGNLSIKLDYPEDVSEDLKKQEISIPLLGLNQVLKSLTMSCPHLSSN